MIVITGASAGIGAACAELFAAKGKNLLLLARREERLRALSQKLESEHKIKAEYYPLDVADMSAVARFGESKAKELAQATVLVNNAGLATGAAPLQEMQPDEWKTMWETNVSGLIAMTRLVVPYFLKKDEGHVVNIGSVAGRWVYPKGNVYCATKAAVKALNEAMRMDFSGSKIRVTEIAPGMAETEFSLVRLKDAEKAKRVYQGMEPLTPRDIAEAVVWCTERPAHVNVQELVLYPTSQASTTMVTRK